MGINNERKSGVVIKAIIDGKDRNFCFPEKTDPEAIKAYILILAKNHNLEVDPKNIYYMGNQSLNINDSLDSLETINDYIDFLIKLKQKEKEKENTESKYREWDFSFSDVVEKQHHNK